MLAEAGNRSDGLDATDSTTASADPIDVSIVVPVFEEEESLPHLHEALVASLSALDRTWEIVYCDDGSSDNSFQVIRDLAADDTRVRAVRFRRNFGQTAAMAAGFDHARGEVIIPIAVVFPAPLGPSNAKKSPLATSRSIPRSAVTPLG